MKNKPNNSKLYIKPQVKVYRIFIEDNIAAGSAIVNVGSSDNYAPDVENWDDTNGGSSNQRIEL